MGEETERGKRSMFGAIYFFFLPLVD